MYCIIDFSFSNLGKQAVEESYVFISYFEAMRSEHVAVGGNLRKLHGEKFHN